MDPLDSTFAALADPTGYQRILHYARVGGATRSRLDRVDRGRAVDAPVRAGRLHDPAPRARSAPRRSLPLRDAHPRTARTWAKWRYRKVVPFGRLVLVRSFSEEQRGGACQSLSPDRPFGTLSTFMFADRAGKGGGTALILRWNPLNPIEAERRAFDAGRAGMSHGWGGRFAQLEGFVIELLTGATQRRPHGDRAAAGTR